ncbi:MAG: hypothetical protein HN879_06310, partial [Flavobacteriaceae bacterium]|nr:hypothetical protein [Flavobacteriaceae bacterium]
SSTSRAEAIPILASFRNPLPMSVRSDQEIAGLMMWVPSCILYVISSVEILFHWYDDNPAIDEIQQLNTSISDK